ncbi:hypothetical protein B0J11DRAFT_595902 [Dendryphion nanum]|uniref:Uncharacterized protein n=1 Tax=Dendryphion nanum TaxID=256645 RepID=A0A9P9EBU9_9PLEO|nr:hypothetical protein B0J11DRAFT_595902 [Dendryphion nanum]
MLVYNYREGDQNPPRLRGGERYSTEDDGYLQQHDGIKEEYYDDRDRRIPGDGVMVKYSELGEYSDFLPRHDDEDPRHAYVYIPRANQRGYVQYAGPLAGNLAYTTAAAYGGLGGYYGAVGYPYGRYGSYGGYGTFGGYNRYGYGGYYPRYGVVGGYRYANYPYQPYYAAAGVAAAPPQYAYAQPAVVARPAVVAEAPASWAYVSASRTPKVLPSCYYSRDYDSRRYAPERDVYAARRIKPADARPEDPFWCRERDGHWHMRTYYSINRECYPGRWKMDPERGFLVFHRD